MKEVTVYSIVRCSFCDLAKNLLAQRQIPFREVLVDKNNADAVRELFEKTKMRTFPQIFIGDKLVGGYQDLVHLDVQGGLTTAVGQP